MGWIGWRLSQAEASDAQRILSLTPQGLVTSEGDGAEPPDELPEKSDANLGKRIHSTKSMDQSAAYVR